MLDNLSNAFNRLLSLKSRDVTITRPGVIDAVPIKITPSNFARELAGPEDISIKGREYIISKHQLSEAEFPKPRKGDRIVDAEEGSIMVDEVTPMYGLGGSVIGYRIRFQ